MSSASFWTLTSCTCNTVATELLSKAVKGSSFSLLTFFTFLSIALEGLVRHPEYLRHRHIPLRSYLPIVLIFFLVSAGNNYIFSFEIPFPLIIIFRSGTLVANVLLTWLLQNRCYSFSRIISVLMITAGIVLFTLGSERQNSDNANAYSSSNDVPRSDLVSRGPQFFVGILIMSLAMFASAYLGILQEKLFMLYGKHPEEMMLYVHLLSLPLFVFVSPEIKAEFYLYWNSSSQSQLYSSISNAIPDRFLLLIFTIILQLICIRSVYQLAAELNSFQVTLVLTLRKFLNILFSVLLFKNEFGLQHFFSASLVLLGYFSFYDGYKRIWHRMMGIPRKEKAL